MIRVEKSQRKMYNTDIQEDMLVSITEVFICVWKFHIKLFTRIEQI